MWLTNQPFVNGTFGFPLVVVGVECIDPAEVNLVAQPNGDATGAESTVRNTAPFNLFGIPTISIPCGFDDRGLPIGLQISGPALGELPMFALAHAYEQATDWRSLSPPTA